MGESFLYVAVVGESFFFVDVVGESFLIGGGRPGQSDVSSSMLDGLLLKTEESL